MGGQKKVTEEKGSPTKDKGTGNSESRNKVRKRKRREEDGLCHLSKRDRSVSGVCSTVLLLESSSHKTGIEHGPELDHQPPARGQLEQTRADAP